ncbi:hypothetical protein D3C73_706200 [compost metagenome]
MADHVQIPCHLGHEVAGAVMIVIFPVLPLNLVVQINADAVQHVLGRQLILHGRKIGQTRTQQRKADHPQTERDEQPPFIRQILHGIVSGNKRIHNTLAEVRIHNRQRGANHR